MTTLEFLGHWQTIINLATNSLHRADQDNKTIANQIVFIQSIAKKLGVDSNLDYSEMIHQIRFALDKLPEPPDNLQP